MMNRTQTSIRTTLAWVAATSLAGLLLAGCVVQPPPRPVQRVHTEAPPPSADVYAYPLHGQAPQQQDRDHYECSQWATQQTGFDHVHCRRVDVLQRRARSGGPDALLLGL